MRRVYNDTIFELYAKGHPSVTFPRFVIIGAQPGAGKSGVSKRLREEFIKAAAAAVHVDIDELRQFHPHIDAIRRDDPMNMGGHTHQDAGEWTGFLLHDAKSVKNNIIFEVTLGNINWIEPEIKAFQRDGYSVDMHVMAVHESISRYSLFKRFEDAIRQNVRENPPRFVPVAYHDEACKNLPDNVDHLERRCTLGIVTVNNRAGTILYRRDDGIGNPGAKDAILLERSRAWTKEETATHIRDWQDIIKTAEARPDDALKPAFYLAALQEAALMAVQYPQINVPAPAQEQDLLPNIDADKKDAKPLGL